MGDEQVDEPTSRTTVSAFRRFGVSNSANSGSPRTPSRLSAEFSFAPSPRLHPARLHAGYLEIESRAFTALRTNSGMLSAQPVPNRSPARRLSRGVLFGVFSEI